MTNEEVFDRAVEAIAAVSVTDHAIGILEGLIIGLEQNDQGQTYTIPEFVTFLNGCIEELKILRVGQRS